MAKPPLKKLFKGKDSASEEKSEARAVRSGKISPPQYAKGEKMEGTKMPSKKLLQRGQKMKSGKLTPQQYAKSETKKGG